MPEQNCVECGQPINAPKRKFCSVKCRQRDKNRRFAESHPGYWADWEARNRDQRRKQRRALYAVNPERFLAKCKRYRSKHKDKIRAYKVQNRARSNELSRARYAANKEQARAYRKQYREANRDKINRKLRESRASNIELSRQRVRDSHKRNPQWKRSSEAKRRAIRKGVAPEELDRVNAFYAFVASATKITCRWCTKQVPPELRHVDHIVPLSRGGRHAVDNLCCSCFDCNVRKGNKLPDEWLAELSA